MVKLSFPSGSLQQNTSCRSARLGIACVLGALVASCATGVHIDDDVLIVAASSEGVPADESLESAGDPGPGLDPITQPAPVPVSAQGNSPGGGAASSDPVAAPSTTNPELDPILTLDSDASLTPALPVAGHCLAAWEGSSCDICSGQTQDDRLACRVYIDCHLANDCGPVSCGSLDQACGVNRLGNGFAPKDIADTVYGCMCSQ